MEDGIKGILKEQKDVEEAKKTLNLSKEEIEKKIQKEKLQQEKNKEAIEILNQLNKLYWVDTPKKVDTLTIDDLTLEEVLQSLHLYKPRLDEIFFVCASDPDKVGGYNGVNHFLVMNVIDKNKRRAMMDALLEVYEPDFDGISAYVNLYINAMMPEWVLRIFMDKHKLSRSEAINQIKAQDDYNLYLEAQSQDF